MELVKKRINCIWLLTVDVMFEAARYSSLISSMRGPLQIQSFQWIWWTTRLIFIRFFTVFPWTRQRIMETPPHSFEQPLSAEPAFQIWLFRGFEELFC